MKNIYHSLLLVIAGSTQKELASQIKYLKVENQILRSKLGRKVPVSEKERRRLVKFAGSLTAKMVKQLASIVHPETLLRWVREDRRAKAHGKLPEPVSKGRPKTPEQMRRLIRKLARENDWGYTRIMGELKKLGMTPPSRNTVKNILKAAGLDPGPQRGEGTWDEFLSRHAASLWQCDFFSRRVLTPKGIRQAFVLAFLNVETRRVILSPATYKPNAEWVEDQAEAFVEQARGEGLPVARLMRDRDSAFSRAFDDALRRQTRESAQDPVPRAEHERLRGAVRAIDQAGVPGPLRGLRPAAYGRVVPRVPGLLPPGASAPGERRTRRWFRRRRASEEPDAAIQPEDSSDGPIACRQRLGGLLKHYYRQSSVVARVTLCSKDSAGAGAPACAERQICGIHTRNVALRADVSDSCLDQSVNDGVRIRDSTAD